MVASARPSAGAPRPYHFPAFEVDELSNGSKLIVCPVPKLPLATLLAVVETGSAADPKGLEGVARLTSKLLTEGAGPLSGAELAQQLERIGTSLETGADWDSSIARITFLSEHLDEVLSVVSEVLLKPTFPERELQRLKSERIADLLQIESEPRALADEAFETFLYEHDSRFAIQSGGSKESVAAITGRDVSAFYARAYSPKKTTFIVAGDVSLADVRKKLSRALEGWRAGSDAAEPRTNRIASASRRLRLLDKKNAPQSELRVGHAGIPRAHSDYFPVVVMNAILGGLFGSRINLNLREDHGYTYGASSYFDWRRDVGPFVISTAVATDVTSAALTEILREVDKIRESPVSTAELSLAKDYLDGVFPIRYETTASIAAALANLVVHRLPADYYDTYRANIQSVSSEQVLAAARAHLKPQGLQTLVVGDVSAIREPVEQMGLGKIEVLSEAEETQ